MRGRLVKLLALALAVCGLLTAWGCQSGGGQTATPEGGVDTGAPVVTDAPTDTPEPTVYRTLAPGQLQLDNGVIYTAENYTEADGSTFTFKKGLSVVPVDYTGKHFNRITLRYTSTRPLKVMVKYTVDGTEVDDAFFLEAGENNTFHGLILGYLDGSTADSITELGFNSLKSSTNFTLHELSTERVEVHADKSYYLENARYKVGIRLSWGGGINYIEDKTSKIDGLTNLINTHDTGRLVQQSYYGAGDSTYTDGTFNGQPWPYNPVQGGDQYGNSSRLIDIEIGANYVYIKSQPQDWSQNNLITPSYMENTYTVEADYIRVDNRFVDFSNYPQTYANQELPAFYTVSYLACFSWYNGINSWTDEPVTYRDALNFWGDAKYADDCRFHMKGDNTETWCAWTNQQDNFGIGLFVPNIDLFYAGRYKYNGTKDANKDPTNYVAPLLTIKLQSFVPLEYSYLIATGSLESIRATFKTNKDFADNASLHKNYTAERDTFIDYTNIDFTAKASLAAVKAVNKCSVNYMSSAKALRLRAKAGGDPQARISFDDAVGDILTSNYNTLTIEYMIPTSNSSSTYCCDLFFCTGTKLEPDGSEQVRVDLICDGEYHTLTVKLDGQPFWTGKLNNIRFDFFDDCSTGDEMYLKAFRLTKE